MTIAKVQHYVPQFLLRSFGNGKKDQVWVYDKPEKRTFSSNTRNVASESRFYDFEHEGEKVSLEPWLSELEGRAKTVIGAILDADSLSAIGPEQRGALASFLAVQLVRTKNFREQWVALPRLLAQRFEMAGDGVAQGSQAEALLREISHDESKEQTARLVASAPATYAAHLLEKEWVLGATPRTHPFWLSDNPLTRQNLSQSPLQGNLGLLSPGIEIYLPLSPTRALAMWCRTLTERVHQLALAPTREAARAIPDPETAAQLSDALLSGKPMRYSVSNVENFNSLQVASSERYIFSPLNEFGLAERMLRERESLARGPRPTLA